MLMLTKPLCWNEFGKWYKVIPKLFLNLKSNGFSIKLFLYQLKNLNASILNGVPSEVKEHMKMLLNTEPSVRPDADQLSKVSFLILKI